MRTVLILSTYVFDKGWSASAGAFLLDLKVAKTIGLPGKRSTVRKAGQQQLTL